MRVTHRIRSDEFVFLNRQFATLIKTNLPVVPGLRTLAKDTKNRKLRELLEDIAKKIESGKSLTEAFSRYPSVFSPTYLAMIKAGEASGSLQEVLHHLALHCQRMNKLQKQIKQITVYPVILITAGIAIFTLITIKLAPSIREVLTYFPNDRISKFISFLLFFENNWHIIFISFASLCIIILILRKLSIDTAHIFFENVIFRIPFYGRILQDASLSRFSRNLAMLLKANIPLPDALQLAGETSGCLQIKRASGEIVESLESGKNWINAFSKHPVFSHVFRRILKGAEKSGDVKESLVYMANFYDEEFERKSQIFLQLAEPVIIIILGILIALVGIAAFKGGMEKMITLLGYTI